MKVGMARPLPDGPELEQARRMWRAMEERTTVTAAEQAVPASPWVLVCANGFVHVEAAGMPTAETRRCAEDAAEFMDDERDDSPWKCGPHTVREGAVGTTANPAEWHREPSS